MAETVDTRVVEAKFDSSQFEKGVDKTVKKLDELKKSLELKDTGKTVAEFASKTQEATEKASNSLEKLNDRFTSFTGMLKQKFISGIADEVVGAFFKMKQSFESFVSSLSTGQIGQGMQRYTDILTSVRTMTAAGVNQGAAYDAIERLGIYADQTSYSLDELVSTMSKFKTAGASLDTARRMVEGLSNAAASMGVNAQQAGRAYLNMQQAYSKGAMLQEDWRGFESLPMVGEKFNQKILEAAESVGTLKKEANGTYTAVAKVIKATGGGKASTGGELGKGITAQNMGTKLGSRFFTKAVMEKVFGESYYFSAIDPDDLKPIKDFYTELNKQVKTGTKTQEEMNKEFDEFLEEKKLERHNKKVEELNELLEQNAITQEEYNIQLEKFDKENILTREGYEFFVAGQEARSFNDVLNTLKDTISRGWATSFEYLFGKLDEAADFFTWLAESRIASAIYAIGEFRNSILEIWHGDEGDPNSGFGMLRTALENIDEIIGNILSHFTIFSDDEDKIGVSTSRLGNKLIDATQRFKDFTFNLKTWLESTDKNGVTRYERIGNAISMFSSIVTSAFGAINIALHGVEDSYGRKKFAGLLDILSTLEPVLVSLWGIIEKVVQPIQKLFDPAPDENGQQNAAYKGLQDSLNNLYKLSEKVMPVLASVLDVIGDVVAFFVGMSMDTISMNIQFFSDVFGFLMELIFGTSSQKENSTGVIEGINNDIATLGQTCKDALGSIKDFFGALFDDIRKILGISEDNQNGNIFENITKWFEENEFVQSVKKWVDKAIADVGDFIMNIPTRIKDFFQNMFYTPVTVPGAGTIWMKKPLTQWLENAANTVWQFITVDIPNFINSVPSIIAEFVHGLFYQKQIDPKTGKEVEVETPLKQWFETAKTTVWNFITVDIPNFVKSIPSLVGSFIHSLFYKKEKDPKTGEEVEVKTAVKEWFDKAIEDVKAFIKDIPNKAKKLGISIGDFFKGIFYYKTSVGNTGKVTWVKKPITLWLENAMKTIGTAIGEFVKNIPAYINTGINFAGSLLRSIIGALFGNKDGSQATNKNVEEELKKPFEGVNLSGIVDTVKGIGRNIVNQIVSIFTGSDDWESNKNWLANGVANGINWIKEKASEAWEKVKDFIVNLPTTISNLFTGNSDDTKQESSPIATAILGFAGSVGTWISEIPGILLDAWKDAEKYVGNLWRTVVNWITGKDALAGLDETDPDAYMAYERRILEKMNLEGLTNEEAQQAVWREDNPIAANLDDFFKGFIEYIKTKIEHLPEDIAGVLAVGSGLLNTAIEGITDWFKKEDPASEVKEATAETFEQDSGDNAFLKSLSEFGSNIAVLITKTIPGFIVSGFNWVKSHVGEWIGALSGIFSGGEKNVEDEANKSFGDKVAESIRTIPERIRNTFNSIKGVLSRQNDFKQEIYDNLMAGPGEKAANAYKNQHTNPILTFFQGIVDGVKNIFNTIGPVILEGLKKGVEWVGGKLGEITTWLTDQTTGDKGEKLSLIEILDKQFTDKETGEESVLWTGIKSLGQTIFNFLTTTIPQFISAAVKKIAEDLPSIISGIFDGSLINNLFGGGSGNEASAEEKSFIEKSIEDNITSVADTVEKSLGLDEIFSSDSISYKKAKKQINNKGKESESIAAEMVDMYTHVLGVNKDAANKINKQKTKGFGISDLLMGTAEAEESSSSSSKKKSAVENVVDGGLALVDGFKNLTGAMGSLLESDVGKKVALILAIGWLLNTIRDTISISETIRTVGTSVLKATVGAAIAGIVAILGYITYISATGTDTQFNRVQATLDKVKMILDAIGAIVNTFMTIKTIKDIGSGITDTAKTVTNAVANPAMVAGSAMAAEAVGFMATDLVDALMGMFEGMADSLRTIATSFGDAVNKLMEIKDTVDDAITIAGKMVTLLGKIEEMAGFSGSISTVESMMPRLTGALNLFKGSVSGVWVKAKEITDSIERLINMKDKMGEFAEFAQDEKFEDFKYALGSLGAALSLYSGAGISDQNGSHFISGIMSTLSQILGDEHFEGLINQLNTGFDDVDARHIYSSAEKVVILAGAIASIGKAAEGITITTGTDLQMLFSTISTLELPTDDEKISKLASNFGTLGNALSTFANNTKDFDKDSLDTAKDAIVLLRDLSMDLKGTGQGFLEKLFAGDDSLENFGKNLSIFGEKLHNFFEKIQGVNSKDVYNAHNIDVALYALRVIADSYKMLNEKELLFKTDFSHLDTGLTGLGTSISTFLTSLRDVELNDEEIDKVRKLLDIVKVIAESAALGVGNNADTELSQLGKELDPEDNESFAQNIIKFFNSLNGLTVNADAVEIFSAFADVFRSIAEISAVVIKHEHGSYEKQFEFAMQHLTEIFQKFNDNYGSMKAFFENVKDFDQEGIVIAMNMFAGLNDLAQAMTLFSDTSTILSGMDNMALFDWKALAAIFKEKINTEFGAEDNKLTVTITPVITMSDEDKATLQTLQSLSGLTPTLTVSLANELDLPTKTDFNGWFETLFGKIDGFSKDLQSMRFTIYGSQFAQLIYPDIVKELAYDNLIGEHTSFK